MREASRQPEVVLDGLVFPEFPRWREGQLWFADFQIWLPDDGDGVCDRCRRDDLDGRGLGARRTGHWPGLAYRPGVCSSWQPGAAHC